MTGNDIRKKFLDFFASKKHTVVASDSLVPKDDPTVLFTTAGMQQFKRQFLGYIEDYTRATTSQKCLRTDDLEQVGKTDFHHTFFEMLGNFSFGDYFKKEAIAWAWEFLTQTLSIPQEKLWVSVYKDDTEAEEIWLKDVGVAPARLVRLGDKSNFWPSEAKEKGPNGPCGPCSEIFYDYGVNVNCAQGNTCGPDCNCGRFSEVWNLVFTQFNRKEGGVLEPLPNKNIDTGMGLERLTAVMQGKKNNFETDLFKPIMTAVSALDSAHKNISLMEKRIIADHLRAIVFGIYDGVVPSNEGRGYVIKKLIIDITDIALKTGNQKPVIFTLVPSVALAMRQAYPEISDKTDNIAGIIRNVEEAYIKVRRDRLPELKSAIDKAKSDPVELGQVMFTYRDTYGLTVPTILTVMEEINILAGMRAQAEVEFKKHMERQQKQSRASSKMTGDVFTDNSFDLNVPKTQFMGYDHSESTSTILKMYIEDRAVNEVSAGDFVKIILDRTPFYAESGGQVGDSGFISHDQNRIRVTDTQKINDVYIHSGNVENGFFKVNDQIHAAIDLERRLAVMRHHTVTHLLQAGLRHVLGSHVQQQGSLVADDRLRFDFTHHKAITAEEITRVEEYVNGCVLNCDTVTKDILPIEEARKSGALAFFAEKYGKTVRVVSVGNYSKEFCGGTHLDSTGQIGFFKITAESAIAQGIRRLEAKAGTCSFNYVAGQERQLAEMARILKAPVTELVDRLHTQTKRLKQMEKELERFRFEAVQSSFDAVLNGAETLHNGAKMISHSFQDVDMALLRKVSDALKQKVKSSIILLGARTEDNASILIAVTDDLVKKGVKADEMITEIAPLINGSGGGRPQLAQAGSKDVDKVSQAMVLARKIIKEKVNL
jgi:alanyl-tRNA synthetase